MSWSWWKNHGINEQKYVNTTIKYIIFICVFAKNFRKIANKFEKVQPHWNGIKQSNKTMRYHFCYHIGKYKKIEFNKSKD